MQWGVGEACEKTRREVKGMHTAVWDEKGCVVCERVLVKGVQEGDRLR